MSKNLEWLKNLIGKNFHNYTDTRNKAEDGEDKMYYAGKVDGLYIALRLIDQLDEPEVLSQEWIEDNTFYNSNVSEGGFIFVDDLRRKLVLKQELPVIPQFVADILEENTFADLPTAFEELFSANAGHYYGEDVCKWIVSNEETFARAWLDGYTVEEEQKFVVEIPNPNNHMGRHKNVFLNKKDGEVFIDSANLFVNDITKYGQYALTEEEIKKDFEWAWVFAKPVEELEE